MQARSGAVLCAPPRQVRSGAVRPAGAGAERSGAVRCAPRRSPPVRLREDGRERQCECRSREGRRPYRVPLPAPPRGGERPRGAGRGGDPLGAAPAGPSRVIPARSAPPGPAAQKLAAWPHCRAPPERRYTAN